VNGPSAWKKINGQRVQEQGMSGTGRTLGRCRNKGLKGKDSGQEEVQERGGEGTGKGREKDE